MAKKFAPGEYIRGMPPCQVSGLFTVRLRNSRAGVGSIASRTAHEKLKNTVLVRGAGLQPCKRAMQRAARELAALKGCPTCKREMALSAEAPRTCPLRNSAAREQASCVASPLSVFSFLCLRLSP